MRYDEFGGNLNTEPLQIIYFSNEICLSPNVPGISELNLINSVPEKVRNYLEPLL